MNILCSINERVIRQFKCLIYSLAETQNEDINLFLLNASLTPYQQENINKYTQALGIQLYIINVPQTLQEKILNRRAERLEDLNRFFSIEVYFRLFVVNLLPKELTRILWLDADVIVQKDLYNFYHFNFQDSLGVVSQDAYDLDWDQRDYVINTFKKPIGLEDDEPLFNSGVFLMNLEQMRKDPAFSEENILKVLRDRPELRFDQDILNFLCRNKVIINKDLEYNYPPNWQYFEELKENLSKKYILHYYGIYKPWLEDIATPCIGVVPYKRCEKMSKIIDKLIGTIE